MTGFVILLVLFLKPSTMKKILIIITLLLFAVSCNQDDFNINDAKGIQGDYAVPLIKSRLETQDILNLGADAFVEIIDPENQLLAVKYSSNILAYSVGDYFAISTLSFDTLLEENITPPSSPTTLSIPYNYDFNLISNFIGSRFTNVDLSSGEIRVYIYSPIFNSEVNYSITFPSITLNGGALIISGSSTSGVITADISKYNIKLDQTSLGYNELPVNCLFEYSLDSQSSATQQLNVSVEFANIEASNITGYLGQLSTVDRLDTVNIELFNNDIDGSFQLFGPVVDVTVSNSVGAEASIQYSEFKFLDTENGQEYDFLGPSFPNPQLVDAAPDQSSYSEIHSIFDESNTAVENIFNERPKKLFVELTSTLNPNSNIDMNQFISYDDSVKVDAEVTIPLKFWASDFAYIDTVSLTPSFDSLLVADRDPLNEIVLKLICNNNFPFTAAIQLQFLDSNNQLVHQIFDLNTPFISSASVDTEGFVTEPTVVIEEIPLENENLYSILQASQLIVHIQLETNNAQQTQPVSFSVDNSLEVNAGLRIKTNI